VCDSSSGTKRCTECLEGFTGVNCEFEISDKCASYPCINGGECTGNETMYECSCPSPYSGKQCQVNGDPCAEVTCNNGGICITVLDDSVGVCNCSEKWQGKQCEEVNEIRDCGSCRSKCYEAPVINSSVLTTHYDKKMTSNKCRDIMLADPALEFYIVAGRNCYVGSDPLVTEESSSWNCLKSCPGSGSQQCGDDDNA
ncbi:hypothetical protein PENTCL1PPCAC_10045, partial [Pristionchus entomophagus]